MASAPQAVATREDNQSLATMPFEQALDVYSPNFAAVLPDDVSVNHFKRMVVTAVNTNPDLRWADRRTLFNACVKCASDGLLPDGREAALVVYRTKMKDRDGKEHWLDAVQYMPMIAGIRKRMRNTGEVLSAIAEVVYRNDKFRHFRGEDARIEHEPAPLGEDAGPPIGAYAIIKLANGEVLRDVMSVKEIEISRNQSRAKDSLMWTKFWGEGARKTVMRRCSKAAPMASGMRRLLEREEEAVELPPVEEWRQIPPRPQRQDFLPTRDEVTDDDAPMPGVTIEPDQPISDASPAPKDSPTEDADSIGKGRAGEGSERAPRPSAHDEEPPPVAQPDALRGERRPVAPRSLIVPIVKPVGKPADWLTTASTMIEVINTMTKADVPEFRRVNDQALGLMRGAHREQWTRVQSALRELESA